MSTKTKTRLAKIVSVFVGVVMLGSLAAPASAVTVEELQAQIALLTAQLASLQSPTTPTTTTGLCRVGGTVFGTNLTQGSTGNDVLMLQKTLNTDPAIAIGPAGTAGAPGFETSYYGSKTVAAVGRLQTAYRAQILDPIGLSPRPAGSAYPTGPATRNFLNGLPVCGTTTPTNPTNPTTPVVGSVTASLAPSSPAASALISGQAIADLAHFNLTNLSGSTVTVTNMQLTRTGISNDATLSNVYLYDGVTRLTDAAGISNGIVTFNQPSGLFTIPAGSTRTISVRSDIAASTAGQIVGVSLTSVTASGTAVAGTPVAGANHSIATATLATGDWSGTVIPTTAANVEPQNDYTVWQSTLNVGTRALNLGSFALRQVGSINQSTDIRNFRLYVDGVEVAQTANVDSNGYVTFNTGNRRLETGGRVIRVVADIVTGASKTFSFQLRQATDAMLIDSGLNQPIVATVGSSSFTIQAAPSSGNMTIASSSGGSVSVTKSNDSPTGNITAGASNQKFATFEFRASGESMKIESLNVKADANNQNGGLDNGKVFVNGVQVGSTKDLTDNTEINFTFGSSFIIPAGETAIVDIYADAKTTTAASYTNGSTVTVTVADGSSNAQGMSSLQTSNVPSADTAANQLTLTTSSLSATKYSGYGDQTVVAGTNNVRLGSFVLSAGSSEGVNVNTITVALSAAEAASTTNLWLRDTSTGAQIGTVKNTPSTSNAYSVSVNVPASGTKTIDVVGNIISGSDAGPWTAQITANGTGSVTGSSATASSVTLQTITVGSGQLTVARSGSNPSNANVIAGGAQVKNGVFKFTAVSTSYTIQEVKIKVPNGAATSVTNVTIKYQDSTGSTRTSQQALSVGTEAYATATFTGLTMYVPKDDTADLEVWVGVPTVSSGATTGTGISVVLDYNEGFKAQPAGGSVSTSVGSADLTSNGDSGKGTMYVKKSVPVIAQLANSGSPATTKPIYKFTVTADSAGDIEIRKMNFNIATAGMTVSNVYLKNETTGTNVDESLAPNGSGDVTVWSGGAQLSNTVETVGAGQTVTYGLYGTVAGWNSGDSLSVSLKEDTSATTSASSVTVHSNAGNFIWSDRAVLPHTSTTPDWTNGYLVEDIPGVTSW